MNKICIGITSAGNFKTNTVMSLLMLVRDNPDIDRYIVKQGSLVHVQRELVVLDALKSGYTHLFFVDTDMSFGSMTVKQLLSHDKDIIGVVGNQKMIPTRPMVWVNDKQLETDEIPSQLFECQIVGAGCMLINLSIFEKIERPWFAYGIPTKENPGSGEDVWFCEQARKAGFRIWCDGSIVVGHIGDHTY